MKPATITKSPPLRLASTICWAPRKASGTSRELMAAMIGAPAWIRVRLTSNPSSSKKPPSFAAQSGAIVALVVV